MADLRCPKCKNFIDEKNLDNCPEWSYYGF